MKNAGGSFIILTEKREMKKAIPPFLFIPYRKFTQDKEYLLSILQVVVSQNICTVLVSYLK